MNLAVCWFSNTLLSVSCNSILRGATGVSVTLFDDLHEANKANGNAMSATFNKLMVFILFLFFMLNSYFLLSLMYFLWRVLRASSSLSGDFFRAAVHNSTALSISPHLA